LRFQIHYPLSEITFQLVQSFYPCSTSSNSSLILSCIYEMIAQAIFTYFCCCDLVKKCCFLQQKQKYDSIRAVSSHDNERLIFFCLLVNKFLIFLGENLWEGTILEGSMRNHNISFMFCTYIYKFINFEQQTSPCICSDRGKGLLKVIKKGTMTTEIVVKWNINLTAYKQAFMWWHKFYEMVFSYVYTNINTWRGKFTNKHTLNNWD